MASIVVPPGRRTTGRLAGEVEHRRFQTHPAGPSVENQIDPVAQLRRDVFGGGRTDLAEEIGARSRNRAAGLANQLASEAVIGNPDSDGGSPDVTMSGICGFFGNTRVSGPGQNRPLSSRASGGT